MSILKTTDLRAIGWYQKDHGYRLQLSPYPTIYFMDHKGDDIKVNIDDIKDQYKSYKKELARLKRRKGGA